MKNFFTEIDGITMTFSDIVITEDGMEYIRIYFEKPIEGGFQFLESTLPMLDVCEQKCLHNMGTCPQWRCRRCLKSANWESMLFSFGQKKATSLYMCMFVKGHLMQRLLKYG